jgi:uncharacterized protein YqeY
MDGSAVDTMKLRLRSDLRAALAERRATDVEVLRSLLGALDQAEAVPIAPAGSGHVSFRFGDPGAEVPRKQLSSEDVRAVIRSERDELLAAADEYAGRAREDIAAGYRLRAAVVERYLESD